MTKSSRPPRARKGSARLLSRLDPAGVRAGVVTVGLAVLIVVLYGLVVTVRPPSSQAADLAVVIEGLEPSAAAGVRIDVLISPAVDTLRCREHVPVVAVISGTPDFWRRHGEELSGHRTVGIGLRTRHEGVRLTDYAGYDLPETLGTNVDATNPIPKPNRSGRVKLGQGEDSITGARWYTADIDDWAEHRTPLVMEFEADWTSRRGVGSCYVVLPELVSIEGPVVDDARAAAHGAPSIFESAPDRDSTPAQETGYPTNAVTFGRVVVNTDQRFMHELSTPPPAVVNQIGWTFELADAGEEVAIWTCSPSPARESNVAMPGGEGKEPVPDPAAAAHAGCGGLAVVEARSASAVRDSALLIIGALFAILAERLLVLRPLRRGASP